MTNDPVYAQFNNSVALFEPTHESWVRSSIEQASALYTKLASVHAEDCGFWDFDDDDSWMQAIRPYRVTDGVLRVPVKGVLLNNFPAAFGRWATGYEYIWEAVKRGMADENVKGIAFEIDSPGGLVSGNFELVDRIYEMRGKKPMRSFATDYAYSAAYSIASVGDRVAVSRSGGVGSIGVILTHIEISDALGKQGVTVSMIRSKPRKGEGGPFEKLGKEGRRGGTTDERHLWPHWHHLIRERRPPVVFGEQVASKDGLGWLDLVQADLEGEGYAVGAEDRCAAGYGAPHIRQRLFFGSYDLRLAVQGMDDTAGARRLAEGEGSEGEARDEAWLRRSERGRDPRRMVDRIVPRLEGHGRDGDRSDESRRVEALAHGPVAEAGGLGGVAEPGRGEQHRGPDLQERDDSRGSDSGREENRGNAEQHGGAGGVADDVLDGQHRGGAAGSAGRGELADGGERNRRPGPLERTERCDYSGGVADDALDGRREECALNGGGREGDSTERRTAGHDAGGGAGRGADSESTGRTDGPTHHGSGAQVHGEAPEIERTRDRGSFDDSHRSGPLDGFWRDADWLFCRDGKWRPVGSGSFPLVDGAPRRMGCMCAACGFETVRQGMSVLWSRFVWDERLLTKEILRQGVLPTSSLIFPNAVKERGAFSSEKTGESASLLTLPIDNESSCSPHRPGSFERYAEEPDDPLCELSRQGAFEHTGFEVRGLRDRIFREVTSEPEQNMFCSMCKRVGTHFCEEEVGPTRNVRLRAYGNAIVAPVAAAFIADFADFADALEEIHGPNPGVRPSDVASGAVIDLYQWLIAP